MSAGIHIKGGRTLIKEGKIREPNRFVLNQYFDLSNVFYSFHRPYIYSLTHLNKILKWFGLTRSTKSH